jgi:hypothetical protein
VVSRLFMVAPRLMMTLTSRSLSRRRYLKAGTIEPVIACRQV